MSTSLRRKFVQIFAVTAAIGGSLILSAPVASAAVGDIAPSCVTRAVYETPAGFDVYLKNNCGGDVSVKVIVDNGGDSPCYVMSRGVSKNFIYEGIFGSYGKTVTC